MRAAMGWGGGGRARTPRSSGTGSDGHQAGANQRQASISIRVTRDTQDGRRAEWEWVGLGPNRRK